LPPAAVSRCPPSLSTAAIGTEEEDEETREKKSPRRPVMPPESLRFELEQSSLLSDDTNIAGRAATATTWASSSRVDYCDNFGDDEDNDDGGDDDEFFHEIANYGLAPSSTAAAAATAATDNNGGGSRRSEKKLLISFVLMVIVGTGNKIFQKLQAIPV
jgi:hypothetical protein